VIVELQEQLLARRKKLENQDGAIISWEESLMAFARMLREASLEHDTSRSHTDAI
jgi:hypothetical protein